MVITLAVIFFLPSLAIILFYIYSTNNELASNSSDAILITGCDSGIGLELAKYFYKTTKFTIICGFLNRISGGHQQLSELADESNDSRLITLDLDITSDNDISAAEKLVNQLIDDKVIKGLFALINNAGIMTYGELDWLTSEQITDQINVNLVGTIQLTRILLPFIIQHGGRIVNVSSVNDVTVFPGLSIYSATKSALSALSRGLGYELRKFNAHVVTVRLGDFARLTNIMSKHSNNCDEMRSKMSGKKRMLYDGYFDKFNNHLLENYGMTSPGNFDDSSLFTDFRCALLAKNPPNTITCAPVTFKIFYFIMELLPVWMQYQLLDLLFYFCFNWKHSSFLEKSANSAKIPTLKNFMS